MNEAPAAASSSGAPDVFTGDVVVTPVISGTEVVELLEVAAEEDSPEKKQEGCSRVLIDISVVSPGQHTQLGVCNVRQQTLFINVNDAEVHFAGGESDAESIRDYNSGPGPVGW